MADTARYNEATILAEHLPVVLDGGVAERARIGLVTLATDLYYVMIDYFWQARHMYVTPPETWKPSIVPPHIGQSCPFIFGPMAGMYPPRLP